MKVIGLIGGMSWKSTLEYYRIINETVKERLGELHSAKCIIYSFDFAEIEELQRKGRWNRLTEMLIEAAQKLESCGAGLIVICSNTMHKLADKVQAEINIPLIHIIDVTAEKILERNIRYVGLLGTRFTMEEPFYRRRLEEKYSIKVVIPNLEERKIVDRVIFKELVLGVIKQASKKKFKQIIYSLMSRGAEGIILGCTEIPLLIRQEDVNVPLFDTITIHAKAAVEFALEG